MKFYAMEILNQMMASLVEMGSAKLSATAASYQNQSFFSFQIARNVAILDYYTRKKFEGHQLV